MFKIIQLAAFFTGLVFVAMGVTSHHGKPPPGSIQAGFVYLRHYDKDFAKRQMECAENPYCNDESLLNGSPSRP